MWAGYLSYVSCSPKSEVRIIVMTCVIEQGERGAPRNGRNVREKRHARAKTLHVIAQLPTAYV